MSRAYCLAMREALSLSPCASVDTPRLLPPFISFDAVTYADAAADAAAAFSPCYDGYAR